MSLCFELQHGKYREIINSFKLPAQNFCLWQGIDKVYVVYIVAGNCKVNVIRGRVAAKNMKAYIVTVKAKLM